MFLSCCSLAFRTNMRWKRTSVLLSAVPFQINASDRHYNFTFEPSIYSWWEKNKFFEPRLSKKGRFVIVMPPPNMTGKLHMGHAIFLTLQDIVIRFKRMLGYETVWIPGEDHAGIASQLLVERQLLRSGWGRHNISREKFATEMWNWKADKVNTITEQIRRMGASVDWSRERFTMDEGMSNSVVESFISFHNNGLIHRGDYMVNWSPMQQTAISDVEVEWKEVSGKLYYVNYKVIGGNGEYITVSTTRPETILGDVALCVHPDDERFAGLVGKTVTTFIGREIPVIADNCVNKSYGSGVLKVTPAHSVEDFAIAKRHNLPVVDIFNPNGTINENGGDYRNLDRFECRKQIWKDLHEAGLAVKEERLHHRIPVSQRTGDVIEMRLSTQWFLNTTSMAKKAEECVRSKELTILPQRFEGEWYNWLQSQHNWCISRQLSWGHRIPVYYVQKLINGHYDNSFSDYVVARSLTEAKLLAEKKFGGNVRIIQEQDVLDTWFSAGLWPCGVLGWPILTKDFEKYYPSNLLETGHDILFFWVARMVMMCLELTGMLPFHTVYLHGLVLDKQGMKMSKSRGNAIDPIDTVNEIGCDALRMSLVSSSTPGQDIRIGSEKLHSQSHFVNKLWNIGKYVRDYISNSNCTKFHQLPDSASPLFDQYIVSKCRKTVQMVTAALDDYRFSEASKLISDFVWLEFADWYIESSKCYINNCAESKNRVSQVLLFVWDCCLRLLHPFMPFVTESLWQLIPHEKKSIMISEWPTEMSDVTQNVNETVIEEFHRVKQLIVGIRNAKSSNIQKECEVIVKISNIELRRLIRNEFEILCKFIGSSNVSIVDDNFEAPANSVHIIIDEHIDAYLIKNHDPKAEVNRLHIQKDKTEVSLEKLRRICSNDFEKRADQKAVSKVKNEIMELEEVLSKIKLSLNLKTD